MTIVIICLNVLIFFSTRTSQSRLEHAFGEAFEHVIDFYATHSDIDVEVIIDDENRDLKNLLLDIKQEYGGGWIESTSTHADRERLKELVDELSAIKYSLPSYKYGLIPRNPKLFGYLSSMFMHGGFFHLFFNMLFLWLAGCNIEDKWGRPLYAGFYLLGGIIAAQAHVIMFPQSTIPLIGASGAIAGAMGAFLVKMYKTRIKIFYTLWLFLFFVKTGTFHIPAYVALPFWFIQQIYFAMLSSGTGETGGVAFWAHIGGFAFGMAVAYLMQQFNIEERFIKPGIDQKISIQQHPALLAAMEKFDLEQYDEALANIKDFLKVEPNNLDGNIILGQICSKQGKTADAAQAYRKVASRYLADKNHPLALSTYLDMKGLSSDTSLLPRDQLAIAYLFEKEGNAQEAADAYERLITSYPEASECMKATVSYGSMCFDVLKRPDKAMELFQKARERCDRYPEWTERMEEGLRKARDLVAGRNVAGQGVPAPAAPTVDPSEPAVQKPSTAVKPEVKTAMSMCEMRPAKLYSQGILLDGGEKKGLFKWELIKCIAIGCIAQGSASGNGTRIIDLIYAVDASTIKSIRIRESMIDYCTLFDPPPNNRTEGFTTLVRMLLHNTTSPTIPASLRDTGLVTDSSIPSFRTLEDYESCVRNTLGAGSIPTPVRSPVPA
ncbi:MAG: rhomboid family intramembrane serine protease [bacterium]